MKLTVRQSLTIVTLLAFAILLGTSLIGLKDIALDAIQQEQDVYTTSNLPPYDYNQDFSPKFYSPLVRLETEGGRFFCTGTVISDDYVLTAAHCLMDHDRILGGKMRTDSFNVVSQGDPINKAIIKSTAAALAQGADYALVKGDYRLFTKGIVNARSTSLLRIYAPVVNCGFPHGGKAACYTVGNEVVTYIDALATSGTMFRGMSGGPVVDASGTIFAINRGLLTPGITISALVGMFESLGVQVLNDETM